MAVRIPTACALACGETVIVEQGTGRVSLINTFSRLRADTFPFAARPFVVAAALTDGEGDALLHLRIEDMNGIDNLIESTQTLHFGNPLQVVA